MTVAIRVVGIAFLLKIQGLRAIQPKSFKPRTTESKHRLGYSPNLLLESDEPTGINQLWVGDITYVPLVGNAFSYLATLMDRHSRRIVGWQLGEDMTEALVLAALTMAIRTRSPDPQLIHHTDRGGQYAGFEYRAVLRRAEMRQSMSRAGDCYDNAFMESCFGTIKTELEMTEYENHGAALKEIGSYFLRPRKKAFSPRLPHTHPIRKPQPAAKLRELSVNSGPPQFRVSSGKQMPTSEQRGHLGLSTRGAGIFSAEAAALALLKFESVSATRASSMAMRTRCLVAT